LIFLDSGSRKQEDNRRRQAARQSFRHSQTSSARGFSYLFMMRSSQGPPAEPGAPGPGGHRHGPVSVLRSTGSPAPTRSGHRRRPVANRWLAMITSAVHPGWPGDVVISDVGGADLPPPSIVRPANRDDRPAMQGGSELSRQPSGSRAHLPASAAIRPRLTTLCS
jgi:hypothetical protein